MHVTIKCFIAVIRFLVESLVAVECVTYRSGFEEGKMDTSPGSPQSWTLRPLVKADLTYLMWIIIKITAVLGNKEKCLFIEIIVSFVFLLTENYKQQIESITWAKVNVKADIEK